MLLSLKIAIINLKMEHIWQTSFLSHASQLF